MLPEGKGTAAPNAVKRYVVTFEDMVKQFCWCDCEVCESDWNYKMQAKEVPGWATHFVSYKEVWYSHGPVKLQDQSQEIPK